VLAVQGALEGAAAHAREALERSRRAGQLTSLVNTLWICCAAPRLARDLASLRSMAGELSRLAEAHGYPLYAARARSDVGWLAVEEGRVSEGIGLVEGALAEFRETGNALNVPQLEGMLSEAHLLAGDADAALAHVEEALRVSARTGEAWFDAELHRLRGGVLMRLDPGDAARAEGEFRRALDIARSQSALLFDLRATRDLARLLRDRGRTAEARDLLVPVYASFTEGFGFPDLVEARALLEELGAAPMDDAGRVHGEAPPSAGPELRAEAPGPSPAPP
jgi:predicted ATPase